VATIRRVNGIIIPEPNTKVEEGDILLAVVKTNKLDKIKKRFGL